MASGIAIAVIPAKAGTSVGKFPVWTPAFAGMTVSEPVYFIDVDGQDERRDVHINFGTLTIKGIL